MSGIDDVTWMFSNEWSRDKQLRDEIENSYAAISRANAATSRVRSQLTRLQGSMESRLQRLTTAFDAYVELGDVREQLLAYADSSATRRAVIEAIMALAEDRRPAPLPEGGANWLEPAMNGVIAVEAGTPDPEAEARAAALSRDAELFHVVLLGALGRGDSVADRVVDLMITDGDYTPAQQLLFEASVVGLYGDVLPALKPGVERALSNVELKQWSEWLGFNDADATKALRWLTTEARTTPMVLDEESAGAGALPVDVAAYPGPDSTEDKAAEVPVDAREKSLSSLRTLAIQMASTGLPGERELLERARELRQIIEAPSAAEKAKRPSEAGPRPVADVLLAAHRALPSGDPGRVELFSWFRPHLGPLVDQITERANPKAVEVLAQTTGGHVVVRPDGVDTASRQKAEQRVQSRYEEGSSVKEKASFAAAGVALVVAVVCFVLGAVAVGVVLLVVAGIAGALGVMALRERRQAVTDRAGDLASIEHKVAAAKEQAKQKEQERIAKSAELDELRAEWGSVAS
ncbi:hypothetical protein ACQBAR_10030 [Propionibacteriaceae bacterium Y1685]|uniref:hypothetical protein n=1 Tax=Microlunatus sp. Y1700 TaxID=3418487 RepID=UPI003B7CEFA5